MNSFLTIAGKSKELKEKMLKKSLPRFKNKLYATSNYIEQIFNNDTKELLEKVNSKENIIDKKEIEQKKNFIREQKIKYIGNFLNKINNNLSKRRLKPIFSIRRRDGQKDAIPTNSTSMINVKRFKSPILNQIIFKNRADSMINFGDIFENKSNNLSNTNEQKNEDDEYEIDKEEEKENVNEMGIDGNKNKISKFDLSNKSTETKNTLFQNESKLSS